MDVFSDKNASKTTIAINTIHLNSLSIGSYLEYSNYNRSSFYIKSVFDQKEIKRPRQILLNNINK